MKNPLQNSLISDPNTNRTNTSLLNFKPKSIPPTLTLLLVLLILQVSLSSTIGVLKLAQGYIGFDFERPMTIDNAVCPSQPAIIKYYGSEVFILSISLAAVTTSFILTLVQILITICAIVKARKLGFQMAANIDINSMHLVLGAKIRKFMYLIQSIIVMCTIILLGHYFSYYLNSQVNCTWLEYNSTQINVIWILSFLLIVFEISVWISIFAINMKSIIPEQRENVHRNEMTYREILHTSVEKEKEKASSIPLLNKSQTKPNLNTFHTNDVTLFPSRVIYYNMVPYPQPQENQEPLTKSKVRRLSYSNNINNQTYAPQGSKVEDLTTSKALQFTFPVPEVEMSSSLKEEKGNEKIQSENELKVNNEAIGMVEEKNDSKGQEENEGRRITYKKPTDINFEEENYLRTVSRARIEDSKHTPIRAKDEPTQSRKIFPFALSPTKSPASTYGDRNSKLHGTYFQDETYKLNKKKHENMENKKKKGALSEYVSGNYH